MSVCHFDFYYVNVMRKKIAISVSGVSACYEQCFNQRLFTNLVPRAFPYPILKGKALGTRLAFYWVRKN